MGRQDPLPFLDLTDADIQEAMAEVPGYLDITAEDFRVLYRVAVEHAAERLCRARSIGDIMRADAPSAPADTPLLRLGERMARENLSFLPVIDGGGRVVGVVTARDLLNGVRAEQEKDVLETIRGYCEEGRRCLSRRLAAMKVADIMQAPRAVTRKGTLGELKTLQMETGHARYPVIDEDGRLLGVVYLEDLMQACTL